MEELLGKGFSRETIHGYVCSRCKGQVDALREVKMAELPQILLVHVNRLYEAESSIKLKNPVEFPLEGLDLSVHLEARKDRAKPASNYRLTGVVVHYGTAYRGHYVAFCREDGEDTWIEYNDLKVREVSASQMIAVAKENMTMLVYERE